MIAQRIRKLWIIEILTNQKRPENPPFLKRPIFKYTYLY